MPMGQFSDKAMPALAAKTILSALVAVVLCMGQDAPLNKGDSLAVKAILQSAGVPHFQVRQITETNSNGKVVSLIFQSPLMKKLAPEIGDLDALESLHLGENRLEEIPQQIGRLKHLKVFSLRAGTVQRLPEVIGELEQLESLDLYGNKLTHLPESIVALKNLKQLRLGKNCLELTPDQVTWAEALDQKWRSSQLAASCKNTEMLGTNLVRF